MNKISIGLLAGMALASGVTFAQQSANNFGGNNVDNVSSAIVGNLITVTLTLDDGDTVEVRAPTRSSERDTASPQVIAQAILVQLNLTGGAAAGPLALAIIDSVRDTLRRSAAGSP